MTELFVRAATTSFWKIQWVLYVLWERCVNKWGMFTVWGGGIDWHSINVRFSVEHYILFWHHISTHSQNKLLQHKSTKSISYTKCSCHIHQTETHNPTTGYLIIAYIPHKLSPVTHKQLARCCVGHIPYNKPTKSNQQFESQDNITV